MNRLCPRKKAAGVATALAMNIQAQRPSSSLVEARMITIWVALTRSGVALCQTNCCVSQAPAANPRAAVPRPQALGSALRSGGSGSAATDVQRRTVESADAGSAAARNEGIVQGQTTFSPCTPMIAAVSRSELDHPRCQARSVWTATAHSGALWKAESWFRPATSGPLRRCASSSFLDSHPSDSDDIDSLWELESADRVRSVKEGTARGIDYGEALAKIRAPCPQ